MDKLKFAKIAPYQSPTFRAVVRGEDADDWFDKDAELATQEELNDEFSAAPVVPKPISVTIYRSTNDLVPYDYDADSCAPVAGYQNLEISSDAFVAPNVVVSEELDFNFAWTAPNRLTCAFTDTGYYFAVFTVYPKQEFGERIVFRAGIEVQ